MNAIDIYRRAIKRTFGDLYGVPTKSMSVGMMRATPSRSKCDGRIFIHEILTDEDDQSPKFVSDHDDPVTVRLTEDEVRQLERAV